MQEFNNKWMTGIKQTHYERRKRNEMSKLRNRNRL